MVATAVAFTRSVLATRALPEHPIEAAATGHLDRRYLASWGVRTARLPDIPVGFRGRTIELRVRALHHRRAELVDVIVEVDDEEAATYLATFELTSAAAAAELFSRADDRCSIAALHDEAATGLIGHEPERGTSSPFRRVICHRSPEATDERTLVPGVVAGHWLRVAPDRLDVHAETTVLADERLGYAMVVGLSARSALLIDDITRTIDGLALAAGDARYDLRQVLDQAAETQRRAVVVQREVTAHRLLSPALREVHAHVDEVLGVGGIGRDDLGVSVEALRRLTESLFARSVEQRIRTWERYGLVAFVVLVVVAVVLVSQSLA